VCTSNRCRPNTSLHLLLIAPPPPSPSPCPLAQRMVKLVGRVLLNLANPQHCHLGNNTATIQQQQQQLVHTTNQLQLLLLELLPPPPHTHTQTQLLKPPPPPQPAPLGPWAMMVAMVGCVLSCVGVVAQEAYTTHQHHHRYHLWHDTTNPMCPPPLGSGRRSPLPSTPAYSKYTPASYTTR